MNSVVTSSDSTSTSVSIVNLFKQNNKPRTKLFIQFIPPGFGEEEFKDLIKDFSNDLDYFLFKPGKILQDTYGHLIGLDCPNYGFALINFKSSRSCPKFYREFHQMPLSDCYNIKAKLFIEFALMQEIATTSVIDNLPPLSPLKSYRDLPVYSKFLKTYPFAAKAAEREGSTSTTIELDDSSSGNESNSLENLSAVATELETKLSILPSPTTLPLPQLSFSKILAQTLANDDSGETVTPLTQFVANTGMAKNRLRRARNKSKKELVEKKTNDKKKKKKEPKKKEQSNKSNDKKSTTKNEQLTQNPQTPPIKGIPKILSHKQDINPPSSASNSNLESASITPVIESKPPKKQKEKASPKSPPSIQKQKEEATKSDSQNKPVKSFNTKKAELQVSVESNSPTQPQSLPTSKEPKPVKSKPRKAIPTNPKLPSSQTQPQVQTQTQAQAQTQTHLPVKKSFKTLGKKAEILKD